MGDRSNPILFGPEWLRNLPSERGSGNSGGQHSGNNMNNPNNQTAGPGASGAGGVSSMAPPGHRRNGTSGESAAGSQSSNQNQQQSSNGSVGGVRVQLANLRYGREEMLALYEAAAEPPQELKNNELLYQPRGKPPFALSTTFEEEMRENMRSSPHAGGISSGDRFNIGRGGMGRGVAPSPDNNNRPRFRTTIMNRSPTASSGDPQADAANRPQVNSRTRYQPNDNKGFYLNYTGTNVMFRNKRQNNPTNWNWRSSQTRESGEEWRNSESARSRSGQERERDRERPGDRPHAGSNRRSMSDHNEESMPEWAYTNAEACAGTFDASGAFHGYSNDDSNLPKTSEGGYSLARSRTHNTLTRSKTAEEGSDEWWASEKAKKLSPKRFDAGDIKFKQGTGVLDGPIKSVSQNSKSGSNKDDYDDQKDSPSVSPEPDDKDQDYEEMTAEHKSYKQQFSENTTYDDMLRNDMSMEEQSNEGGNFQSVMINTNNSLRQKHQNLVVAAISDNQVPMNRSHPVMLKFQNQNQPMETDHQKQHQMLEEKMIDRFLDMSLEADDISSSALMGSAGVTSSMPNAVNSHPQMPGQGLQLSMQGPNHNSPGLSLMNAQGLSTLNLQPPIHNMPQGLPNVGMNNPSMVLPPQMEFGPNSSIGIIPMPGGPQGVMPNSGMSNHGLGGSSLQNPVGNMPSFQGGNNMPGMSNNNAANTSMLFGKNLSNTSMPQTGDIPMPPNHNAQSGNLYPIHGLQHSSSQNSFGNSMFNNLLQSQPAANQNNIAEQWFYEDPEKNTQGPFTSREMYRWYRAGFFTPSLMVRRACESQMRPLGSYGPLVPFVQLDMLPPFPMSGFETRAPMNHTSVMNVPNISEPTSHMKPLQNAQQNQMQIPMQNPMQIPMQNQMLNQIQNQMQNLMQHQQMQNQMHSPMHSPLQNQMHSPMQNLMINQMHSPLQNQMHSPMQNQMINQMHSPMQNQMINQMHSPMQNQMINQMNSPMQNQMVNQMQSQQMQNLMQQQMHSPMQNPRPNAMHNPIHNTLQFGNVGIARNPPLGQPQNMFDSLWGQPPQDVMWMQRNPPIENRVNNLPMYFWDQQASNSLLPEDIPKDMKTEDQILAQLRASQNINLPSAVGAPANMSASVVEPTAVAPNLAAGPQEDAFSAAISTPYFEELQKMIQKDILSSTAPSKEASVDNREPQPPKQEKDIMKPEQPTEQVHAKAQIAPAVVGIAQPKAEPKIAKQTKVENEKALKSKESSTNKNKNKKFKEEKKDEMDLKVDDSNKADHKRSVESSPVKTKKEDKINKKELEKEKKEWLKEGFTIVKGAEKVSKDIKKKAEEAKAAEEVEKKRKEEERQAAEEEKKKRQADAYKKQQVEKEHHQQLHQQRQMTESIMKKAPWSAASQSLQATNKEGLTLTEIQRLEREKKLEQMKEQQQMMAILAQQQAAALAREQEMQANLGWAKKKAAMANIASQSLSEIQAETRKQASVAAASIQVLEEERPAVMSVPWASTPNGGGFWDTPSPQSIPQRADKPQEVKPEPAKPKKKNVAVAPPVAVVATASVAGAVVNTPTKKETTPAAEFETWCTTILKAWSSKIDVPTFIGFLKDIESPYEVKDYVKCYLGESKDSGDFSRQFLERRSKLLRVGMVTPSDDLCSPAMAINPRTNSGSDYQEVKGKGKKTKKNKMLKVDARILGFSVTAAEDRINVGDIDSV